VSAGAVSMLRVRVASAQSDWQVPDSRSTWFWSQVVIDTDFS
jgi:hypothetical protein